MFFRSPRPKFPRRGVTLVEMLISVALLVLMMTVIVQVFAAATGSVSSSRTFQELDGTLRHLDGMIRGDLRNITAKLTPPNDPDNNDGYFEYGENSFADMQGEDTDDYVRFTVKAPEGQFFTGRFYAAPLTTLTAANTPTYLASQPITISSQHAEVIYFLRNGNLYRRVLLVAPDRQAAARLALNNLATYGVTLANGQLTAGVFGGSAASWQGLNDISARPIPTGTITSTGANFILNTLGDLTNRENRFGYSRWANDFINNATGAVGPDGIPDDANHDTVPDFYPTLYYSMFQNATVYNALVNEPQVWTDGNGNNITSPRNTVSAQLMAFPYMFPGAFSKPDPGTATAGLGWIHTPDPSIDQTTLLGLQRLNHNPIDIGDSLPLPPAGTNTTYGGTQTWWGFPTWRETMSTGWIDPFQPLQNFGSQPPGLTPHADASVYPPVVAAKDALPPMDASFIPATVVPGGYPFRLTPQFLADAFNPNGPNYLAGSTQFIPPYWPQVWEDDLVATGVRSFDIKVYDSAFLGYADLGWGDDLRITAPVGVTTPPFLTSNSSTPPPFTFPLPLTWNGVTWNLLRDSVAHEGRIPPRTLDYRRDPQMLGLNGLKEWDPALYATNAYNVGDDTVSVNRLRRVWDSWSTDYTNAPSTGVNPANGQPFGPPFGASVYPSYPPPYPMPLRGIQIQIRVTDPRNEKVKTLTIRHDFNDNL